MTPYQSLSENELAYFIALDKVFKSTNKVNKMANLLETYASFENIWRLKPCELAKAKYFNDRQVNAINNLKASIDPMNLLKQHQKFNVNIYPYWHKDYPDPLRHIHNPPMALYVNKPLSQNTFINPIALVGTRNPSFYGQKIAKQFGQELIERKFTIISGMANGVDSICHNQAICANSPTIAVLGNSIDICYPRQQGVLHRKLLNDHLVISEYPLSTQPKPWQFPERNRIIAGLSLATLVIEAPAKSGSLITAKLAFEQGKPVFAVPTNIDNNIGLGSNFLIANNIAKLVVSVDDVCQELNISVKPLAPQKPKSCDLTSEEAYVMAQINNYRPVHFDDLCLKLGLDTGKLSSILTILEINGLVQKQSGNLYVKN